MSQAGQSGEAFSPSSKPGRQEIQKVEQELKKRKMFEDGMSPEDMMSVMEVVLKSEKEAGMTREETPEPAPPIGRISYAKTLSNNATTLPRKSSSPELSSSQQSGKRLSLQEKQSGSSDELMYGSQGANPLRKEPREGQHSNANRGRAQSSNVNPTPDGRNSNKRTNHRPNTRVQQDERLPKFKINPFEFADNGKDARLARRYRSFVDRSCEEGGGSGGGGNSLDNSNKAIARLCVHLRQISEFCHSRQSGSIDTNFQWGTAIKIGETNETRGDGKNKPDEEVSSDFGDDLNNRPKSALGDGIVDETTRRRKVCASGSAIYAFGGGSDEDDYDDERENSDEDFQLGAKRQRIGASSRSGKRIDDAASKTAKKKNVQPVTNATSGSQAESTFASEKVDETAASLVVDVSDECTIHDDDDETDNQPPRKVQKNKSAENDAVYPRRIVPPNPTVRCVRIAARKSLADRPTVHPSRAKKPVEHDEKKSRTAQPVSSSLRDEEIADVLERNDEDDSVVPVQCDTMEIRPLRISSRMKMQSQRLVQLQEKEKEIESVRREQNRMKDEMIRLQKMQRVQQRIRDEKERQKRQEESERAKAKREEEWRVLAAQSVRKRPAERTELHPDGPPRNDEADMQTNNFAMDQSENEFVSIIEDDREQNASRVRCPICNRSFTPEAIEAHAGACEEYDSCPPGISRSSSPSLTPPKITTSKRANREKLFNCEICDNFSTDKGKTFENHTNECIKRKNYGQPLTPDTIIEVPTSPLRTVRTISEQTGSEINYKSQFVPRTRSNKIAGKKRKR